MGEIARGLLGAVPVEDCQVGNNAHHEHYLVDKLVVGAMEEWGEGGRGGGKGRGEGRGEREGGKGGGKGRGEEGKRISQVTVECKRFCFAAVHHVT